MKRSEINSLIRSATQCYSAHGWALPPNPRWDITDFGLGASQRLGLVLVNLAEEPEYCEKLMYAQKVTICNSFSIQLAALPCFGLPWHNPLILP